MNKRRLASLGVRPLTLATLLLGLCVPRAASAVQSAELYRTQAYFYGRFEARIRFAPGEGVVSSFFLWKDGSSSTTPWNELDYEKINSTCHLQTNIWSGMGTQSAELDTPSFNICSDYHTYGFEWTPDYIAWFIDGNQIRKVTGSLVTFYTQNASQGMSMHFNTWEGNSTFGGTLDPSTLPVHEFISWAQYSSYSNGAFQLQWREEFTGSTMPSNWAAGNWASPFNLSTDNPADVTFANGIAVLSMTADNATGYTGTPPADPAASTSGTGGSSGTGGTSGTGGATGSGGTTASGGTSGTGGASATGGKSGTGGASATGGATGTGGATSTGGVIGTGTGGASATGGTSGTGGVSAAGGGTGSGGVSGTGGDSGTGGSSDTGGSSAMGGSAASGGTSGGGGGVGETGSGSGCSCQAAGHRPSRDGALVAVLLVAACAFRRRPRQFAG